MWFLENLSFRSLPRDAPTPQIEETISAALEEYVYRSQFPAELRKSIDSVRMALDSLPECKFRLRNLLRRSFNHEGVPLLSERDVQDLVYVMLRPTFRDIVPEHNGTGGSPPENCRIDFLLHHGRIGIECKYIGEKCSRTDIQRQLEEDKRLYKKCFPRLSMLFFFLYDPMQTLPAVPGLRKDVSETVLLQDRAFRTELLWYV